MLRLARGCRPSIQSPYRAELQAKLDPLWQDMYDGKVLPADAFKQVSDEIRKTMEQES